VCRRIKAEPAYRDVRVVFFSGVYRRPKSKAAAYEASADGYIASSGRSATGNWSRRSIPKRLGWASSHPPGRRLAVPALTFPHPLRDPGAFRAPPRRSRNKWTHVWEASESGAARACWCPVQRCSADVEDELVQPERFRLESSCRAPFRTRHESVGGNMHLLRCFLISLASFSLLAHAEDNATVVTLPKTPFHMPDLVLSGRLADTLSVSDCELISLFTCKISIKQGQVMPSRIYFMEIAQNGGAASQKIQLIYPRLKPGQSGKATFHANAEATQLFLWGEW